MITPADIKELSGIFVILKEQIALIEAKSEKSKEDIIIIEKFNNLLKDTNFMTQLMSIILGSASNV